MYRPPFPRLPRSPRRFHVPRRSVSTSGKPATTTPTPHAPTTFDSSTLSIPQNPPGQGRYIKTAAALVIGDEILNGKTLERNSNYFARFCFELGIDLKRVEVIPDEEDDIVQASRRMVDKYDLVITSGGIGPTHDDITYASLAKAFGQRLAYHADTLARMEASFKDRLSQEDQTEEQRTARKRMALFPEGAEVLFVASDLWVPVVRLQGKLCVFPGIPALFQKMLDGLKPFLALAPPETRPLRVQVYTTRPESNIAPYLAQLQARVGAEGIRIGSYPLLKQGVYVSLIGRDRERVVGVAAEVERELDGTVVVGPKGGEAAEDSKSA
ncbi:hypothetical protein ID866_9592 [Astraeus odoratus]|nr:hypothetical protein ID866_9592 [Astraeus odoratus]